MMISNKKISILFVSINVTGILISFLYGIYGGSGGETTEGVYLGLFYTNIISVLISIILFFLNKQWILKNLILVFIFTFIYFPVTSIIIKNKINNSTSNGDNFLDFGIVNLLLYNENKEEALLFLKNDTTVNYEVDTIIYSKTLNKLIIFASYKDSLLFKNVELFANKNNDKYVFKYPKGGNFISENLNKKELTQNVLKWYLRTYKNNLWFNSDFWYN